MEPDELPLDCARRELEEETGYAAAEFVELSQVLILPATFLPNESIAQGPRGGEISEPNQNRRGRHQNSYEICTSYVATTAFLVKVTIFRC